jgi:hypothetical protein
MAAGAPTGDQEPLDRALFISNPFRAGMGR